MARKPTSKPGKTPNEKVQLSLPPATLKRLRIAAAELGLDLSEVVAELIDARFSGVHVRGMTSGVQVGQGSGSDALDHPANVAIPRSTQGPIVTRPTITNRIGEISRSSGMPVDLAVESYGD
jgi:hypothetical protein